jgi:O-antigen/teichoic acid export membrane protein
LFSIAAFLGVFFMVQAGKITLIFGGSRYTQATLAIGLMSFYAIHRTYGQLSGSVFLATGQTGFIAIWVSASCCSVWC